MACSVPSHYLKQCWLIINWTLGNILQWKFNENTNSFVAYKSEFESVVCKIVAILSHLNVLNVWLADDKYVEIILYNFGADLWNLDT